MCSKRKKKHLLSSLFICGSLMRHCMLGSCWIKDHRQLHPSIDERSGLAYEQVDDLVVVRSTCEVIVAQSGI
jgi:hypothetical protein